MKKFLLITLGFFVSCSNVQHPDYAKNLETTKQWFEVFVTEDLDATMDFYADELEYQSAFYQGPIMNKAETCLLYTSPSPRDVEESRMPSSA